VTSKGRNWTHEAGIVWPLLVAAGREGDTLIYESVAKAIATNPLSVAYALRPIQTYCLENRLAPLTVVVVGKGNGRPGEGFIAWNVDDLAAARDAVRTQNWDLVGNPFAGFGADEDESILATRILNDPGSAGDVYRRVRDRGMVQRIFRLALLKAYGSCAMCGLSLPSALEAAHILPWRACSDHERMDVTNGLLLCASHHRLFDDGFIRLGDDFRIAYSDPGEERRPHTETDRAFVVRLHGRIPRLPVNTSHRPNPSFLERRYR
jgi:putative restriction endonuclease